MCGGAHLKVVQALLMVVEAGARAMALEAVGRQGQRTVVGPGWGRGAVVAAWGSMSTETAWQGECAGKMRPVASRACDRGALIAIQANGNF